MDVQQLIAELRALRVPTDQVEAMERAVNSAAQGTREHNAALEVMRQRVQAVREAADFAGESFRDLTQILNNNNAELDNGVYNENEEKAKEEEQDGLMGMNQQLESHEPAIDAPMEPMPVSNLNSNIGSLNTSQIMVNEDNVEKMEKRFGFDPNYVISELNNDELNHTTTTYFLIDC